MSLKPLCVHHTDNGLSELDITAVPSNSYDGEWDNDVRCGMGECMFASGDHYVGEWKDNQMNGSGTMYYFGGAKYQGDWRAALRHGFGLLVEPDGTQYEGDWFEDRRQGQVRYFFLAFIILHRIY